jgi:hypothetical protein
MALTSFIQGVAKQAINTSYRKISDNISNARHTPRYGETNTSDQLPLAPTPNVQHFTFPLDVMADPGLGNQGHYMMFFINQQDHAKLSFGKGGVVSNVPKQVNKNLDNLDDPRINDYFKGMTEKRFTDRGARSLRQAASDKLSVGVSRAPTTKLNTAIVMYMPASVTTGYSAQYTDTEIGFVARGAVNAYEKFSQGKMKAGLTEIGNMDQDLAKALTAMMLNTAGALPGFSGVKAVAEMRSGVVLSDRMELAFQGIDKRTFQYEFKMSPKSEQEAIEIRNIIRAFKLNMLPEYEGSDQHGRALIVPNTFEIEYHYNGAQNNFLHKISTCVLESMNVSYGGDKYKTHAGIDGDGAPPIDTTLTLVFKELELITKEAAAKGF